MPTRGATRLPALNRMTFMIAFLIAWTLLQPAWANSVTVGNSPNVVMQLGSGDSDYQLTATSEISNWELTPSDDPNTHAGTLTIDVPDPKDSWTVQVTAESDSGGCLREYDPTLVDPGYVGDGKLSNPLFVKAEGGNEVDISAASTGKTLISGTGDATIALTFEQEVIWEDVPLESGHVYRTVVTFSFA